MKKSIFFAILGMVLLGSLGCTKSKNAPLKHLVVLTSSVIGIGLTQIAVMPLV